MRTQRGRPHTVGMDMTPTISAQFDRFTFVDVLIDAVRAMGAAATLAELRHARPTITTEGYHDTVAVFYVWAIDRLVSAGLSDTQIHWHPLVDGGSLHAWWDDATLRSQRARDRFVASTRALVGEPAPFEPRALVAA